MWSASDLTINRLIPVRHLMSRPIKPVNNSQQTDRWLKPIGKLVMNFSAVELHTYWWLGLLGKSADLPKQALAWPFKKRVDKVIDLLTLVEDPPLREKCISCWQHALEAAKFRNAIVHNPIVFGWTSKDEGCEPEIVGIPDISHLGDKPRLTERIASLSTLNDKVNETAELGQRLFQLLAECDMALGEKNA